MSGWKTREQANIYQREYRKKYPWANTLKNISSRCLNPNHSSYFKKGIKNFLTLENLKYLWFRDKAYLMKKASIDRIDNNEHYKIENCRFIEMTENSKRKKGEGIYQLEGICQLDIIKRYLMENKKASAMQLKEYANAKKITNNLSKLRKQGLNIIYKNKQYILI